MPAFKVQFLLFEGMWLNVIKYKQTLYEKSDDMQLNWICSKNNSAALVSITMSLPLILNSSWGLNFSNPVLRMEIELSVVGLWM